MDLVRDLLDKSVVDRNGKPMGRVDGIILNVRVGRPPTVAAIEIGPAVLAHRIHPSVGRVFSAIQQRLGLERGQAIRIPVDDIEEIKEVIRIRLTIGETGTDTTERAVRRLLWGR